MTECNYSPDDYGLEGRGRDQFLVLTDAYAFDQHEVPTLVELCRTLTLLDRLEHALAGAELLVPGYKGQPTASPLLGEIRAHRQTYTRLFASLNLPELDEDGQPIETRSPRSIRASKAAQARWNR
jgi:hypothetical protein